MLVAGIEYVVGGSAEVGIGRIWGLSKHHAIRIICITIDVWRANCHMRSRALISIVFSTRALCGLGDALNLFRFASLVAVSDRFYKSQYLPGHFILGRVAGCRSLAWRMRTPRKPERHALFGDERNHCYLPASHGQPDVFVKHLFAPKVSYTSPRKWIVVFTCD